MGRKYKLMYFVKVITFVEVHYLPYTPLKTH